MIGLKQRSAQYEHIRIEVEDDGYGMTPEYLETIFDAFTRAENSTTNKVQGTGLGMAITKNIVELMGGTIDVSSEVDKGSLFRVELELRIPEGHEYRKFWAERGISRILTGSTDKAACDSIRTLMEETGVVSDMAGSLDEMMRMMRDAHTGGQEYAYQAVLADRNILGGQVLREAEKIRAAAPKTVPVLFLSSYDEPGMEEAVLVPDTGILTKPFFVSAFVEKIQEMQAGHGKEQERSSNAAGLKGMYFLAAEDNEINAEILSEILKIEGAGCDIAENGRAAVEKFTNAPEGKYDAVLMDVQMPVMNGYDATKAIRALDRKDAAVIPIIAMTANAFAEDEKEALEAGMNVHLSKPVDVELLRLVILQYVSGKGKDHEKK